MYRIAVSIFVLTGDAWAHPGHGAPALHIHGWDYALLAAAIAIAAVAWFRARK